MKQRILNLLLIVTSLFGYLEWGADNRMFLFQGELEVLTKLLRAFRPDRFIDHAFSERAEQDTHFCRFRLFEPFAAIHVLDRPARLEFQDTSLDNTVYHYRCFGFERTGKVSI
jgi:hypothetical protein